MKHFLTEDSTLEISQEEAMDSALMNMEESNDTIRPQEKRRIRMKVRNSKRFTD